MGENWPFQADVPPTNVYIYIIHVFFCSLNDDYIFSIISYTFLFFSVYFVLFVAMMSAVFLLHFSLFIGILNLEFHMLILYLETLLIFLLVLIFLCNVLLFYDHNYLLLFIFCYVSYLFFLFYCIGQHCQYNVENL